VRPPHLSDGHIALRPWREGDARSAADWGLDHEIVRWTGVPPGRSISRRLDWVAYTRQAARAGEGVFLVVTDASTEELLGAIDLRFPDRSDPKIGELGYLLAAPARGRGVMARAVRLLAAWGFSEAGLARVQAMTHPDNEASARVLSRAGFTREGVLRSFRAEPAGREDRVMWSLLPGELVE
jgi:[ribosomal protein S5]-alanine N-acetyltransferase